MKAIETEYFGPTNTRGARIVAKDSDNNRVSIPYPHELNHEEAHALAAKTLKDKMKWTGEMIGGHTKKGMVFVFEKHAIKINPRHNPLSAHAAAIMGNSAIGTASRKTRVRKNPRWQDMTPQQRADVQKARRHRSLRQTKGRAMWSVWSLDVWGNKRDGYEVNDRSRIARISIPNSVTADNSTFVRWLKANGHINAKANAKDIELDGDEGSIYLDYKGKPELQFERD